MVFKVLFLLAIAFTSVLGAEVKYDGYKVYNVVVKSEDEIRVLEDIQSSALGELWNDQAVLSQANKVMVAPAKQAEFLDVLKKANMDVTEVIGDVQRVIDAQLNPTNIRSSETLLSLSWDRYYNLEQIYSWLDELAASYPNIVKTVEIGRSVENRIIKGIIIDYNPERENKLIGMYEGTLHSREWISAATVTFVIKEFLTSTEPEVRALAENFEWHIFPVVNPDGYVYTFTTNRMWRKNRSTASYKDCGGVDNDMSNGVDLNRNFGYMWMTVGASNDSCTNTYAGPSANSEIETQAIINYVLSLKNSGKLMYYIAFHSYTQLIVVPYSHLSSSGDVGQANNYGDMYEIAARGAEALSKRYGTVYRVGVSAEILYPMSGTSFDWVKYETDVPISYLIELRDLGEYGFLLPADQIIPTSLEIMDALVEMDKTAVSLGYYESSASGIFYSLTVMILGLLFAVLNI